MANNYMLCAAIEGAHRSDGAHSLHKVFPISTNRATQQGDYYMMLAHYLFLLYQTLIKKDDHRTIKALNEQWV
jgi:hypothetical protein